MIQLRSKRSIFHCVILFCSSFVLLCLFGCGETASTKQATLPYYDEASFTPHWFDAPTDVPVNFHKIPSFTLLDQNGQVITEDTVEGKLYVANFFFTACPGICPMTMSNMAKVQKAFEEDEDILFLSHSVTPEKDSVAALQAFAQKMHALSSKWYLVTGDREQIYNLGKNFYFAEEDLGETDQVESRDAAFLHTESFFIIDQDRRIRGVYNGMNTASVTQLIADVRALQAASVL